MCEEALYELTDQQIDLILQVKVISDLVDFIKGDGGSLPHLNGLSPKAQRELVTPRGKEVGYQWLKENDRAIRRLDDVIDACLRSPLFVVPRMVKDSRAMSHGILADLSTRLN